jgi:hypothetical protein
MANDPPFAILNHFAADLGIPQESANPRIGISGFGSLQEAEDWIMNDSERWLRALVEAQL